MTCPPETAVLLHHEADHVGIQGGRALSVIDANMVAIGAGGSHLKHAALPGGVNGGTLVVGQIHTVMEVSRLPGDGVDPPPKGRGQLDVLAGGKPSGSSRQGKAKLLLELLKLRGQLLGRGKGEE